MNTPDLLLNMNGRMEELEGYFNTWSALQKFIAANNYNPVEELITHIKPFGKKKK